MSKLLRILLATLIAIPLFARAECVGLKELQAANKDSSLIALIAKYLASNPPCGAAKAVLMKIMNTQRNADFRLEPPRPYDAKQAQLNLDKALLVPRVKKRMDEAQGEADPELRLALEATILFDEGFFGASDLKTRQLKEVLK